MTWNGMRRGVKGRDRAYMPANVKEAAADALPGDLIKHKETHAIHPHYYRNDFSIVNLGNHDAWHHTQLQPGTHPQWNQGNRPRQVLAEIHCTPNEYQLQ